MSADEGVCLVQTWNCVCLGLDVYLTTLNNWRAGCDHGLNGSQTMAWFSPETWSVQVWKWNVHACLAISSTDTHIYLWRFLAFASRRQRHNVGQKYLDAVVLNTRYTGLFLFVLNYKSKFLCPQCLSMVIDIEVRHPCILCMYTGTVVRDQGACSAGASSDLPTRLVLSRSQPEQTGSSFSSRFML